MAENNNVSAWNALCDFLNIDLHTYKSTLL